MCFLGNNKSKSFALAPFECTLICLCKKDLTGSMTQPTTWLTFKQQGRDYIAKPKCFEFTHFEEKSHSLWNFDPCCSVGWVQQSDSLYHLLKSMQK